MRYGAVRSARFGAARIDGIAGEARQRGVPRKSHRHRTGNGRRRIALVAPAHRVLGAIQGHAEERVQRTVQRQADARAQRAPQMHVVDARGDHAQSTGAEQATQRARREVAQVHLPAPAQAPQRIDAAGREALAS